MFIIIRFIGTNANIDLLAVMSGSVIVALGPSPATFRAVTETLYSLNFSRSVQKNGKTCKSV